MSAPTVSVRSSLPQVRCDGRWTLPQRRGVRPRQWIAPRGWHGTAALSARPKLVWSNEVSPRWPVSARGQLSTTAYASGYRRGAVQLHGSGRLSDEASALQLCAECLGGASSGIGWRPEAALWVIGIKATATTVGPWSNLFGNTAGAETHSTRQDATPAGSSVSSHAVHTFSAVADPAEAISNDIGADCTPAMTSPTIHATVRSRAKRRR